MSMYICDNEHRLAPNYTTVVERQETYPVRQVPTTITTQVRVCLRCGADVYDQALDQQSLERAYAQAARGHGKEA